MSNPSVTVTVLPRDQVRVQASVKPSVVVAAAAVGRREVVTFPTGSEPPLTGVPDGTLWVEYTP